MFYCLMYIFVWCLLITEDIFNIYSRAKMKARAIGEFDTFFTINKYINVEIVFWWLTV